MSIAILQCGAVADELQPIAGDYPKMIQSLLTAKNDSDEYQVFDVRIGNFPKSQADFSTYVVTGSKHSVFDSLEWIPRLVEFVRALHDRQRRILGICFGHQLVNAALGGVVERSNYGWGVGVHTMTLTEQRAWMDPFQSQLNLYYSHQDQVTTLGSGMVAIASTEHCPHAVCVLGDHILTLQGHPEFLEPYARASLERRKSIMPASTYADAVRSFDTNVPTSIIGEWLQRFCQG